MQTSVLSLDAMLCSWRPGPSTHPGVEELCPSTGWEYGKMLGWVKLGPGLLRSEAIKGALMLSP